MNDGHDTSCTFRKCAHPESPNPCPFLADEPEGIAVELPKYLPGQVVAVKAYGELHVILIQDARQNKNGSWSYFGGRVGWEFTDTMVQKHIRTSFPDANRGRWSPE